MSAIKEPGTVLTSPTLGNDGGTLAHMPKLLNGPNDQLFICLCTENGAYDPAEQDSVREVVHLRSHDVVIVTTAFDVFVLSSTDFHSQV